MESVPKLYRSVIDEVLTEVRLALVRHGWDDETVAHKMHTMQQKWEYKLGLTGCINYATHPLQPAAGTSLSAAAVNKAAKRKLEAAQERELKRVAQEAAAAAAPPRGRKPLSYPVLDPSGVSAAPASVAEAAAAAAAAATALVVNPLADGVNPYESQPPAKKPRVARKAVEGGAETAEGAPAAAAAGGSLASAAAATAAAAASAATMNPLQFMTQQQQMTPQQQQMMFLQMMMQMQQQQQQQAGGSGGGPFIPQQDGGGDDPADNADASAAAAAASPASVAAAAASAAEPAAAAAAAEPADAAADELKEQIIAGRLPSSLLDPELGPDDDDSDDERAAALASAAASSDPKTADLLVCQFEKVKHLANRDTWKVVLRDGILRINQRDYVFSKATGEFEW